MLTPHIFRRCSLSIFAAAGIIAIAPAARATPILSDSFIYADAGTPLGGHTNPGGAVWTTGGTGTTASPSIAAGSLTPPPYLVPPADTNSVLISNPSTTRVARISVGSVSSGSIFYSFALNVSDVTGLAVSTSTTGAFIAGFSTAAGIDTTSPTQVGGRFVLKTGSVAGTYNIGVRNDIASALSSTGPNYLGGATPTNYTVNTPLFVVVGYTFNGASAADDVASLWINPTGLDPNAAPDVTSTGADLNPAGGDGGITVIRSFLFRDLTTGPRSATVDDLRLGTEFADVVPEPVSLAMLGLLPVLLRRRRPGGTA